MLPGASWRAADTRSTPSRWRCSTTSRTCEPPSDPGSISDGRVDEVGQVNDQAYTFGTDSFSRALQTLPDGAVHIYVFRDDGRPVGCMTTADHEGNTEVQMVAVVPEARGRGIAGDLLRQALADAAERGSETASLVATKMGSPVYEREGFRALGQLSMWERRRRLRPARRSPRT